MTTPEDGPASTLVSVVVRTRERLHMLSGALASIGAQSHRPIEVVLVNDGGPPLDIEALRQRLGDVTLVAVHLPTHQGRARAANAGIAHARGRWVTFLDDDDEWLPQHLHGLVKAACAQQADVVYSGAEMAFASWSQEQGGFEVHERHELSKDFNGAELLLGNYIPFNTVLVDAVRLRALGGIDESFDLYEDWDLLLRLARKGPFHHIAATTARYHQWSQAEQINRTSADAMAAATLRIYDKHRTEITSAVLLEYRSRRDAQLQAVQAAAAATVQERDWALQQAAEQARHDAQELARRQHVLEEQAAHRVWLEQRAQAQDAQWLAQEHRIIALQDELSALRATAGWRLLEKIRRARSRLLPPGTRRGRLFDRALQGLLGTRRDDGAARPPSE